MTENTTLSFILDILEIALQYVKFLSLFLILLVKANN